MGIKSEGTAILKWVCLCLACRGCRGPNFIHEIIQAVAY